MLMTYHVGEWRAVVAPGRVALLSPALADMATEQTWRILGQGGGVADMLQLITGSFGIPLSSIPAFGVAVIEQAEVHLALRGPVEAQLRGQAGPMSLSGEAVSTWLEHRAVSPASLSLQIEGVAVEPSAVGLPIEAGVVPARRVDIQLVEVPELAAPDAAAPPALEQQVPAPPAPAVPDAAPDVVIETLVDAGGGPDLPAPPVPPTPPPGEAVPTPPTGLTASGTGAATSSATGLQLPPPPMPTPADTAVWQARETGPDDETIFGETVPTQAAPEPVDASEYDHLWDSTVARNVEDAAVRAAQEDDAPAVLPAPPAPLASPEPEATGAVFGPPPGAGPVEDDAETGWHPPELLLGDDGLGDHDGRTITVADLNRMRARSGAEPAPGPAVTQAAEQEPMVLARVCAQGHPNPTRSSECRVCGADLAGDAVQVPRPPLGRVVLSTGQEFDLVQPLVIGRKPRTTRFGGNDTPRLVTVPSPEQDISRSHVDVRLEGWSVLLTDLDTTNGTTLLRPGQPPRRLQPKEPTLVASGDVFDLGDGVTVTFADLP